MTLANFWPLVSEVTDRPSTVGIFAQPYAIAAGVPTSSAQLAASVSPPAEDGGIDRSKFKKVEMPIFDGVDPDLWLFRVDRYFGIHKLTDSEKLTVTVINFEGAALDWYRVIEEHDPFHGWNDLKLRLLVRFRSSKIRSVCGQFLAIRQESTVEEYRNRFDKLVAPLPQLPVEVLENTF